MAAATSLLTIATHSASSTAIRRSSILTSRRAVAFNPLVTAAQLPGWLAWAPSHQPAGVSFPGSLLLFDNGTFQPGVPTTPFSVPIWQTFPAGDGGVLGYFDAASDPTGYPAIACVVANSVPCLSSALLGPPFNTPFTVAYVPVRAPTWPSVGAVSAFLWFTLFLFLVFSFFLTI